MDRANHLWPDIASTLFTTECDYHEIDYSKFVSLDNIVSALFTIECDYHEIDYSKFVSPDNIPRVLPVWYITCTDTCTATGWPKPLDQDCFHVMNLNAIRYIPAYKLQEHLRAYLTLAECLGHPSTHQYLSTLYQQTWSNSSNRGDLQ